MTSATSLQGTLDDFDIADVLRLLLTRSRSGVLVVNPHNPLWLVLADGEIVFGGSTSALAIGRHLLASGVVSAEQLETLLGLVDDRRDERANRNRGDADVLEALSHVVPMAELADAVRRQAVATVFEMMVLERADLQFTEHPTHSLASRFRTPIDDVVTEAERQVKGWDDVRRPIGTDATHLRRVRRLGAHQTPVVLDGVEWAALSEIDDRSTVGQIAHRLGLGRYEAYSVLGGLLERGVVEVANA